MQRSPEQQQIIHTATTAAAPYGVALGGAQALRQHGLVDRRTDNVDLVLATRDAKRLTAARAAIVDALVAEGFTVTVDGKATTKTFVRFTAKAAGAKQAVPVTLHVDNREHEPVVVDDVPVLHPDDLAAAKVVTLGLRSEARDAFDVLALSGSYTTARLLDLALANDQDLRAEDFLTGFKHITEREDPEFVRLGYTTEQAGAVRAYFQGWFTELSARRSRPISAALDPEMLAKLAALAGTPVPETAAPEDPQSPPSSRSTQSGPGRPGRSGRSGKQGKPPRRGRQG
ncbi:nucleotidyl transferase AbiEii/AbiGii toxin family protein [Streptomyces sp. SID3343]|uniref:nucleotidyl transferase AbiEii/AbiGii toxin family protein n=1 Tax=Streptomyces sp. SID3343 TaxID=2690260 RepID=UPI00137084F7|nr:hypothetical protein [Streptomyces sp. SID3343]